MTTVDGVNVLDMSTNSDYQVLNGMNEDPGTAGPNDPGNTGTNDDTATGLAAHFLGGRLAEKDAGGAEFLNRHHVSDYVTEGDNKIENTTPGDDTTRRSNRGLNEGALVLPALYGGGDMTKQIMLLLSVADEFGGAGKYSLMAAKTGYTVSLIDTMGDALPDPATTSGPVFGGGADDPDAPAGTKIIVEGIRVMVDAGKCGGDMIMGPWTLGHLTGIVPTASSGAKDFAGLDAMTDAMMNASPGWIKLGIIYKSDETLALNPSSPAVQSTQHQRVGTWIGTTHRRNSPV